MTFRDMGEVFSFLLAYREASSEPIYRRKRPEEQRIADILDKALLSGSLDDFEAFLNAQGFTLVVYDSSYFGAAVERKGALRTASYFVLARTDSVRAHYVNKDWFDQQFQDDRRVETKEVRLVWGVQLWLLLQSLFYTRLGRTVSEISRFEEAVVTEAEFIASVKALLEKVRNQGRPEGDKGYMWDILVKKSRVSALETRAKKFLEVMAKAGMIDEIHESGQEHGKVYRQTLVAAVEMNVTIERGLDYLRPVATGGDEINAAHNAIKGYTE